MSYSEQAFSQIILRLTKRIEKIESKIIFLDGSIDFLKNKDKDLFKIKTRLSLLETEVKYLKDIQGDQHKSELNKIRKERKNIDKEKFKLEQDKNIRDMEYNTLKNNLGDMI